MWIIEITLQVVSLAIQYASIYTGILNILNSNISQKLCEVPSMESLESEKLIHQKSAGILNPNSISQTLPKQVPPNNTGNCQNVSGSSCCRFFLSDTNGGQRCYSYHNSYIINHTIPRGSTTSANFLNFKELLIITQDMIRTSYLLLQLCNSSIHQRWIKKRTTERGT